LSREGSEAPTGSCGRGTKRRKKVVKGKLSLPGECDREDCTEDGYYSSSGDGTRSNGGDNNRGGEEGVMKKRKVKPKLGLPALRS